MLDKLKMLNQARQMQKKMKELSTDTDYNGIKITMNGKQEIISLDIAENLFDDQNKLKELIKEAVNKAITDSQREMATKMQGEMGGMFGM